jgi:hypothetical protein
LLPRPERREASGHADRRPVRLRGATGAEGSLIETTWAAHARPLPWAKPSLHAKGSWPTWSARSAWSTRTTGSSSTRDATWRRHTTRPAGPLRRLNIDKGPLVILSPTVVNPNRGLGALGRHADDAALRAGAGAAAALHQLGLLRGSAQPCAALFAGPVGAGGRADTLHGLVREDRHEIVVGNRVLVFLAEKALLDQHVERRRVGVGELPLEQGNRAHVLVAAEHQLFLFFARHHVGPDRQQSSHDDGHHAHADQQGCHRVAARRPPQALTR